MSLEEQKVTARRVPQQGRSRGKVARILDTAMRLLQDSGIGQVSMREIARGAEVPIATVYQYFPNKQAIVRQIWENYTTAINDVLAAELEKLQSQPDERTAVLVVDQIVDTMVEYNRSNPAFAEIKRCVDATPELRRLNFEDTMKVAELIRKTIRSVNKEATGPTVTHYAMIAAEATSSSIRLGLQLEKGKQAAFCRSLKAFLLQTYRTILESEPPVGRVKR